MKPTKKGKRPKLIKINKVPLTKKRARDLRNYITDTSLSRTARIKPTSGKPASPKLKIPKGYARKTAFKFRKFKQIKGKRISLKKGRVIERGRHILDTSQEVRKIGLLRRIKQITPKKKTKSLKTRKPSRR